MYDKFSVLMSLYIKEKPEYFIDCMESILNQTVSPSEIVIVKDGPLTEEMEKTLSSYIEKYPSLIRTVPLEKNMGLGIALSKGVPECRYELIARMDTDDIARPDRFEKQLAMFNEDPDLDICGSHIIEFDNKKELSKRIVPLTHRDICNYQRQRSAFNHMTVMFKKASVLKAGNYEDCPLMEDDMLWINMIRSGCKCANIDDYLVLVRTGDAMIQRRGGASYLYKYVSGRKKMWDTGYISDWDYLKTVLAQFVVALVPGNLRAFIFTKLLRNDAA